MPRDSLAHWRHQLVPIQSVSTKPPEWIIPDVLVQGMNLIAGDPRTYKTTLALCIAGALVHGRPIGGNPKRVAKRKGTFLYVGPEQSYGTLRHLYETRVLKRKLEADHSYNFAFLRDPWEWQLDEPKPDFSLEDLVNDLKPTCLCIDPLIHFHSLDENDPHIVHALVPVKKAVLAYGGSIMVIHHARKPQAAPGSKLQQGGFERVRGTSALWAMADGGIMASKNANGSINLQFEWKDFQPTTWTWRPP